MTNEQKLREIAEKWGYTQGCDGNSHSEADYLYSDLTALISEGYVSKEEHDKVVQQRDELLKTMKSIYCTTDASDQTSMQHAIYRIGAAIKNTYDGCG